MLEKLFMRRNILTKSCLAVWEDALAGICQTQLIVSVAMTLAHSGSIRTRSSHVIVTNHGSIQRGNPPVIHRKERNKFTVALDWDKRGKSEGTAAP